MLRSDKRDFAENEHSSLSLLLTVCIQHRLEEQRSLLEQKKVQISKKQEIDTKHEGVIRNINFKIDILEQRALRFESIALQKYEEIDNKLNKDPRLAVLHKK